tara:strand:+ start:1773 stop:2468 length:696 start_codon:yes stop_codon:yes gene_type:complete
VALPSSGEISVGMLNFEIMSGDGTTTQTSEVATSNDQSDNDIVSLAGVYSDQAAGEGSTSRANLLAAPYGMDEFYSYTFNSCVLVGTEITMVDRSVKFVEDLLIDDEVLSMEFPEMTDENYKNFSTETIDLSIQRGAYVKTVIFDFLSRYWLINEKLKCTESHPIFAWKDKLQTFEWWQANDLEIGDKLVTQDLKLEEIATMEQLDGDFEIVSLGLRDTHTYFASGYLCHQ